MIYALRNLKAYMLLHLENTLDAIEAEETELAIERWQTLETYEAQNLQFPLIEILPSETRSVYGSNESPLTEHWAYHNIDIEVAVAGQDTNAIQTTLLWYREAFVRIVKLDMTLGGLYNRVRLGTASYSPILESAKERKLLKIMRQSIEMRVERT